MAIQGISGINSIISGINPVTASDEKAEGLNFKDILMNALNDVSQLEQESNALTEDFIAGRTDNIPQVLIASEKASLSLSFVMEVRNKVLEAYQEIMRMQV
jgi:flagellar hook-basal body complex protein FliE